MSFERFLTEENHHQRAVATYMKLQWSKVKWFHPMNEGKRGKYEQFLVKILGVSKGVPDVMIPKSIFINIGDQRVIKYAGLAIELKSKKGKTTKEQDEWLEYLDGEGWYTAISNNSEKSIALIDDYLKESL